MPATYSFFNKFGGLMHNEIGEVLKEMEEKKLNIASSIRLIEDFKQMRYGFIYFLHSLGLSAYA